MRSTEGNPPVSEFGRLKKKKKKREEEKEKEKEDIELLLSPLSL